MWWKTSKDRLIEFLQAELAREQLASEHLREERIGNVAEKNEYAELVREAVALAQMAVSQLPDEKQKAEINKDQPFKPRTMSAWCTALSERSYRRALCKGKNLVADMPPPGAQGGQIGKA